MKYFLILSLILFASCSSEGNNDNEPTKDASSQPDTDQSQNQDLGTQADVEPTKDASSQPDTNLMEDTTSEDCGEVEIVRFNTDDNVELVADYHPPTVSGKGAVVLFHMIPPTYDRTSYPLRVREAFTNEGYGVINVDRRGAGDSGGVAADAYTGPNGRLDVEAAVKYLLSDDRKCAVDASKIMLVGASNGTTSVLDYTTNRASASLPDPKAIAWLSPGGYTEGQNKIADHKTLLETTPVLIIHPASEPWANTYSDFSGTWKILELADGKHGTSNFDDGALEAQQLPALVDWAKLHLGE